MNKQVISLDKYDIHVILLDFDVNINNFLICFCEEDLDPPKWDEPDPQHFVNYELIKDSS